MLMQDVFDFARADLLATTLDNVVLAANRRLNTVVEKQHDPIAALYTLRDQPVSDLIRFGSQHRSVR